MLKKVEQSSFSRELYQAFSKKNKIIPSKFHYDLVGSKYFEKITKTKEYYVAKIEKKILKKISKEMDLIFDRDLTFIEFGSGSTDKIKILINNKVKIYIPLDISFDFIKHSSKKLIKNYPKLKIIPVYCDYTKYFKLPNQILNNKIGFFLGSSIGNFYNDEERKFLKNVKKNLGKNIFLFVGVDLVKNKKILEKAYNDSKGVAAKFNLNLIIRINKELHTNLKLKDFQYLAYFNKKKSRVENFLLSKKEQKIEINNKKFFFKKGEYIQTEISKKFTLNSFSKLAKFCGWKIVKYWVDEKKYYSIFLLKV